MPTPHLSCASSPSKAWLEGHVSAKLSLYSPVNYYRLKMISNQGHPMTRLSQQHFSPMHRLHAMDLAWVCKTGVQTAWNVHVHKVIQSKEQPSDPRATKSPQRQRCTFLALGFAFGVGVPSGARCNSNLFQHFPTTFAIEWYKTKCIYNNNGIMIIIIE
jgi:hypothetical protein